MSTPSIEMSFEISPLFFTSLVLHPCARGDMHTGIGVRAQSGRPFGGIPRSGFTVAQHNRMLRAVEEVRGRVCEYRIREGNVGKIALV